MSVYCISDIHACYDEFIELIDLIEFDPAADQLFILGDVIDRGPQSAEMLWWCMKEAPASVHFLLGNHEDMLYAANRYNKMLDVRLGDSWSHNHGYETIEQIRNFNKYYDRWELEIINWIDQLPLYYHVQVADKDFILVHAGLQSSVQQLDDCCLNGRQGLVRIEGAPVDQDVQALLWNRSSWIGEKYDWPFDIVCGHTPIAKIREKSLAEITGIYAHRSVEGGFLHLNRRKHFIDCGCCRGGKLGCLRLDDMQEFYVDSKQVEE